MSEWGERKAGASKAEVESGKWIAVQRRIFTRWANAYLRGRKLKIHDLCTDLGDGITLINLLEILGHEPMHEKWRKEPKMRIHKLENLKAAFHYMTDKGLTLSNVGTTDVIEGNEKIILGLMWTIIAKFQVGEISVDGVSGKEGLLLWCTRQLADYAGVSVKNFHRSWKDGMAFCALIHKHRPDIIDYDSLSPDNPAENLALAFQLAEDYFGIDRILDVEDIVDAAKPDEKIVITYVAFCFKGYADFRKRQNLAKAIGKAIDITKRHDGWIAEYTEGASALAEWTTATAEYYQDTNHGVTAAGVKETLDAFNAYKTDTKPDWKAKLTALEGLFNTFISSCRNNNRPPFRAAPEQSPAELDASWKTLEDTENAYETSVRSLYRQFLVVERNLAKFTPKIAKLHTWMDAQIAVFEAADYGSTLVQAETFKSAHQSYESQLERMQATVEACRAWAASEGIDRHERNDETQAALAAVDEKIARTVEMGGTHGIEVELSRERHEKNGALDKVHDWVDTQLAFFGQGLYGETLVETKALIEEHRTWGLQLTARREVVDAMTSEQDSLLERIAVEKQNLDTVEEQGSTYEAYLGMQQELFEKYQAMDEVLGWCEPQNALFAAEDYGEDLAAVNNLLTQFNDTFTATLPTQKEVLDTMTSEQESILTRLEEVKAHLEATEEAAEYYRIQLLLSQERLEKLPMLDRVEAWMAKQNELFSAAEYGDSLGAVADLLGAFATFETNAATQNEVLTTMESNQEVITGRRDELAATMTATTEAAAEYQRQLALSQERLEMLPAISRVDAWLDKQASWFAGGVYGGTLAETSDIQSEYDSFAAGFPARQEVVDSLATEQEVILTAIAAAQAKYTEVWAAGEEFAQQLVWARERHETLPVLERISAWLAKQCELFAAGEYGDSIPAVVNLLSEYETFTGALAGHDETLASVSSEQAVITDRAAEVMAESAKTQEAGVAYQQQLVLKQERLEKFAIIDGVEVWLAEQDAFFGKGEYGDDLTVVANLLSSFEPFGTTLENKKETLETITSEQDVIIARRDTALEKLAVTAAASEEYHVQLLLSQERLEKLPALARVQSWVDGHNAVFAAAARAGDYGSTLLAVATLQSTLAETYTATLPAYREVVDTMTSSQDVINTTLDATRGAVDALETAAYTYYSELLLCQERLEKLPVLDRIDEWLAEKNAYFAAGDHGETLVAVATLLSTQDNIDVSIAAKRETLAGITSEQEVITSRCAASLQALEETVAASAAHREQLVLSQERLEKLPALQRVQDWIDQRNAVFAEGDYGETLVRVATLLSFFSEAYTASQPAYQAVLDGMDSEQEVITSSLAARREAMATLTTTADEYNTQLLMSQERLEKLPMLDRVAAWLAEQDAVFAAGDYGTTLVEVATRLSSHAAFGANVAAKKALVAEMETYQDVIQTRINEVYAAVEATEAAAANYEAWLYVTQEQLQKLPVLDRVDTWLATQNELFAAGDYGDTVAAAAARLDAFRDGYERQLPLQMEVIDGMTTEQEVIQTRLDEVRANAGATAEAAATYKDNTQQTLDYYQRLVDLTKEFNNRADNFSFAVDDIADELNEPVEGATLEQLSEIMEVFTSGIKPRVDELTESYNAIDAVARELMEAGVEDAFNRHSLTELYERYIAVYGQVESREAVLTETLAAEEGREALRIAFAESAAAVVEYCTAKTAEVGALEGTLEEQHAALTALIAEHGSSELLAAADAKAQELYDAGIVDNPHTPESSFSLHAQWDVLAEVFERSDESLRGQILAARDETITPEQFKEIKEVFEFFDANGDNSLDRTEFHSCCTGIGLALAEEEVDVKMAELDVSGTGGVDIDEFTTFMMERLVMPGHTRDDVKAAFVDLAEKEPSVTSKMLTRTFVSEEHLTYLTANMPPTTTETVDGEEDAFMYDGFVDDLFSR